VAVTLGHLGASVTGWGDDIRCWGGLAKAFTTRPL
jgi:hypothetical protein